ncbi:hypothetical protein [Roseomonas gilardii]|uniref:hypothetical protein n=1 Tax=Roseomonas gilardii TaxID=257708 RepID=UPI0012EC34E5|nr:hypothetical protein [Roseomonas gilardii]
MLDRLRKLLWSPPPTSDVPQPKPDERYDLLLNEESQAILVKVTDVEMFTAGRKRRVVAANLHAERLERLTWVEEEALWHHRYCRDEALLRDLVGKVEAFMAVRDSHAEPYHGALSHSAPLKKFNLHAIRPELVEDAARAEESVSVTEAPGEYVLSSVRGLSDDDERLIGIWSHGLGLPPGQPERAKNIIKRMAYARLAERLVLEFIPKVYGCPAEDVSLTQLKSPSGLWQRCDIVANGHHLDVKNHLQYGRGCPHPYVKDFKRVAGRDVAIAGVATEHWRPVRAHQVFLGVIQLADIEKVKAAINEMPGRKHAVTLQFHDDKLPAWAFELPGVAPDYELLFDLARTFAGWPETTLAAAIACGREKEAALYEALDDERKSIVDRFSTLIEGAGYSKATIAMFAISEFMARCRKGGRHAEFIRFLRDIVTFEGFSRYERPLKPGSIFGSLSERIQSRHRLRQHPAVSTVVFGRAFPHAVQEGRADSPYEVAIDLEESQCGGLHDPTDSIAELFDLLGKAGGGIAAQDLSFVHFDVQGPHVLVGKTADGAVRTVYANCGGERGGYACNTFPLVIGVNASCDRCGKLICKQCHHCSPDCDRPRPVVVGRRGRQGTSKRLAYR